MKKSLFFKLIVFLLTFGLIIIMFSTIGDEIRKAEANSGDNVFGYAWSENIGWISFNNTSGGGTTDYGVDIDENGLVSGYVWSEYIGWVSFNQSELSGCPSGTCSAQIELGTGNLLGWAKALTISDGWIKLQGSDYGVNLNSETKEFEGWAWGSETIGWISFNCLNSDVCGISDYKVKTTFELNSPPTALNLSVEKGNYCIIPSHSFSWQFSDPEEKNQYAYQLQVGDDFDSGKTISASNNVSVIVAKNPGENQLSYNTDYSWRVKVWDEKDVSSDWVNGTNFRTESHMYPSPDFIWTPDVPTKGEVVIFNSDSSDCYNISNNRISCPSNSFLWIFPDDIEFSKGDTASRNPEVKFNSSGPQDVSLRITDDVGSCSLTQPINIGISLPQWQEVSP